MKIQTNSEVDILIAQHQAVVKCYKKYNDYVNRNTKETKDNHVIFANNVTLRNNYRALERTLRIQLECYGVKYDGKGHYNISISFKPKNHEQMQDNGDND